MPGNDFPGAELSCLEAIPHRSADDIHIIRACVYVPPCLADLIALQLISLLFAKATAICVLGYFLVMRYIVTRSRRSEIDTNTM